MDFVLDSGGNSSNARPSRKNGIGEYQNPQCFMLTLFTDASILWQLERRLLVPFLRHFAHLVSPRDPLPDPRPENEHFCGYFAERLTHPERVPASLIQNLTDLEAMVAAKAPPAIEANISSYYPKSSRLNNALQYWLLHPEVRSPIPKSPPATPPAPKPTNPSIQKSTNPAPLTPSAKPAQPAEKLTVAQSPPEPTNPPIHQSINPAASAAPAATAAPAAAAAPAAPAAESTRALQDDARARNLKLSKLEPWPEPITDAPALFDEVEACYLRNLHLPPGAAIVFTLWVPHAHAINAFTHSPRLNLTSAVPGCGKSTALDLLTTMCPKALRTDNLKPAVLYRVADQHHPTLLLDELDTYLQLHPELRGLLNAGNSPGSCVYRCEGHNVRAFNVYAATALAGLGHLAPTLRDRSIVISLTKAPAGAVPIRFDMRFTEAEIILGRKIARWVKDSFAAIAACNPVMPPEAFNRLGDNWRPLFAIAQIIGGHWPQRVLEAFHALNPKPAADMAAAPTSPTGPELLYVLLADICAIFASTGVDRLSTNSLAEALRALPGRPWAGGLGRGHEPLTEKRLARRLAAIGIHSKIIRIGTARARGYLLTAFIAGSPPATSPGEKP
jgi:putative DNA primase/helicase